MSTSESVQSSDGGQGTKSGLYSSGQADDHAQQAVVEGRRTVQWRCFWRPHRIPIINLNPNINNIINNII